MAEDPEAAPKRDPPVSREEFDRLMRRIERLELEMARQETPLPPTPAFEPPVSRPSPQAAPEPMPPAMSRPAAAEPRSANFTPVAKSPRAAPKSIEAQLGRFAPRVGAVFVFLATLFFLGLAIERGWIGPLAQLGIAVVTAVSLIGIAAWLSHSKGYGTYPGVLEATGLSMAYATAFVAYSIPYYSDVTRLTELGGGTLMALVATSAIGLALIRNSKSIVTLGYFLSFTTAGLGWGVLPGLTLPYVAILGTSLAFVAAHKNWRMEGVVGSLVTGLFFLFFAVQTRAGELSPAAVLAAAAAPFAAFTYLALRPSPLGQSVRSSASIPLAAITLGWGALATVILDAGLTTATIGMILFGWTFAALALMQAGRSLKSDRGTVVAYGVSALVLYVVAAPLLWFDSTHPAFATTLTYTVAALVLGIIQYVRPSAPRAVWTAGLALAAIAAVTAVTSLAEFSGTGAFFGSMEGWIVFLVLAPSLALLSILSPRKDDGSFASMAFALGLLYLTFWGFVLFSAPFLTTMYLLALGGLLGMSASRGPATFHPITRFAGAAILVLVAIKAAGSDFQTSADTLPVWLGALEAIVVAATLHALYHFRAFDHYGPRSGTALVAVGATVLGSAILAYTTGAATSISLALLSVAYLGFGFLGKDASYRYTGFGGFAFVILRVFTVDLQEADLAVRALVFAVLGAILLAVGYGYARERRSRAPPEPPTEDMDAPSSR